MRIATTLMGTLTAAYGVLEIANPGILAKQTQMAGTHPDVARTLRRVSQAIGTRDVISGTALALARTTTQRRIATGVRVAFDLADGIVLSSTLPKPAPRAKILAITGGWAALCAAALVVAERFEK